MAQNPVFVEKLVRMELSKCIVRSLRMGDGPALVRHANDRDVLIDAMGRFSKFDPAALVDIWLKESITLRPETSFAIEADGEAVGVVGFYLQEGPHRLSAEIGCWLGGTYRNRGIATEAIEAVTHYAFAHHELVRMYACVSEQNLGSMRALEKCGYAREGVLRRSVVQDDRIMDQVLFARVRNN
jgi:ribosomal-protein-alanine N-acetyltransferase